MRKIIPGKAYDQVALKPLFDLPLDWDWDWDVEDVSDDLSARLIEGSPISHLTKDVRETYEFRSLLEAAAAERAATRIPNEVLHLCHEHMVHGDAVQPCLRMRNWLAFRVIRVIRVFRGSVSNLHRIGFLSRLAWRVRQRLVWQRRADENTMLAGCLVSGMLACCEAGAFRSKRFRYRPRVEPCGCTGLATARNCLATSSPCRTGTVATWVPKTELAGSN